jgi:methionyl-tRNA synthetase
MSSDEGGAGDAASRDPKISRRWGLVLPSKEVISLYVYIDALIVLRLLTAELFPSEAITFITFPSSAITPHMAD